ncbi:MAG: polyprenyl synthetase family protein [Waddliaceae bacterium]
MNTFQCYLRSQWEKIEKRLNELVPKPSAPDQSLFHAARYSLINAGKRIRPILTLATTEMLEGDIEQALSPACALEMVHTYSMIHDDLPSMDNDDFRRGKPSLHKIYPEGEAILAGNLLLTLAFELIADESTLTPQQRVNLISSLAKNSGGGGMIAGQAMDLQSEEKKMDLKRLKEIYLKKTAALISTSVEFGVIISDAPSDIRDTLQHFAQEIGLAFQIIDDILDVTSSKEKHGNMIASDVKNGKTTYPSLMGLEQARTATHSLLCSAKEKLAALPYDTSILSQITDFVANRTH